MSFTAAFLLAAAATQAAPANAPRKPDRGAQVETARVSVVILRPAVLKDGAFLSGKGTDTPRSQRRSKGGRVSYAFE